MKKYKVIYLKSELISFSWNDGLFAIYKEKDGIYHLWKIKEDGSPSVYEDGTPNLYCTSVTNKGIKDTLLTLTI